MNEGFSDFELASHIRSLNLDEEFDPYDFGGMDFHKYMKNLSTLSGNPNMSINRDWSQKRLTDFSDTNRRMMRMQQTPISPPYQLDWGKRIE